MATMEEAFDMVQNLTEELCVKEQTIMKHENEIKDLEKQRGELHKELYITKQVYERWGNCIFNNDVHGSAFEEFSEDFIYRVASYEPLGDAHEFRVKALAIFMDNNPMAFSDGTSSEDKIMSHSQFVEHLEDARQVIVDDIAETTKKKESRPPTKTELERYNQDLEDCRYNLDIFNSIIRGQREVAFDVFDILGIEWHLSLPDAYDKDGEKYYIVMWNE